MLRKVNREKKNRKDLDGNITQSMMAWQHRRSVQDNSEAVSAYAKAKGSDRGPAGVNALGAAGQMRNLSR